MPPSVAANTAKKPYLQTTTESGSGSGSGSGGHREGHAERADDSHATGSPLRVQVFVLPHFVHQLSNDASVKDQVMKQQIVT